MRSLLLATAAALLLPACGSPAAPVSAPAAPSPAPTPAATTAPRPVTFAPGLYEVGTQPGQIPPGTYTAPGPDGSASGACYWARLHGADEDNDITANGITPGPNTMTVQDGDLYVHIDGCSFTAA